MGRIIEKLSGLFAHFCIATVLAQVIILVYVQATGTLDIEKIDKMLAIVHGVNLVVLDDAGQSAESTLLQEQASLELVEKSRTKQWLALEGREKILLSMLTEFEQLKDELEVKREEFSRIIANAQADLEKQRNEAVAEGRREFEAIYAGMKPKQAKEQLMRDWNRGKIESVVEVLKGMEEGRRAKIVAEFSRSDEDGKVLNDILDNIRNPKVEILDEARRKLDDGAHAG